MHAKFLTPLIALPFMLAVPAIAQDATLVAADAAAVAAPAEAKSSMVKLSATLNGASAVDAQGAPNGAKAGTGSFVATLDEKKNKLCYTLTWSGIDDPTMAHIHAGAAGKNGPVVVGLPDLDAGEHCQDIDNTRADQLIAKPGDFYVNVHTGDYPAGAVRGQVVKN